MFLFCGFSSAGTQDCLEDPEFYQYLSGTIGKDTTREPYVYLMPCDTIIINKGVTVNILSYSYVAFEDPRPENIIIVNGTLIVQGSPEKQVRISSSIDRRLLNPEDQKSPWKGIYIGESGSLLLKNAILFGAGVPITSKSEDLRIEKTLFPDNAVLAIPGKKQYKIPKSGYLESFELKNYLARLKADENRKKAKKSNEAKSIWKSPWLYAGTGLAAAGAVAAVLVLSSESSVITLQDTIGTVSPSGF